MVEVETGTAKEGWTREHIMMANTMRLVSGDGLGAEAALLITMMTGFLAVRAAAVAALSSCVVAFMVPNVRGEINWRVSGS